MPVLESNIPKLGYKYRFLVYYLLLSAYHLDGETEKFEDLHKDFKNELEVYSGTPIPQGFREDFTPDHFEDGLYGLIFSNKISDIEIANQKNSEATQKNSESLTEKEKEERLDQDSHKEARKKTEKIREIWRLLL